MTAHDQIRAMLDELMGTARDGKLVKAIQSILFMFLGCSLPLSAFARLWFV